MPTSRLGSCSSNSSSGNAVVIKCDDTLPHFFVEYSEDTTIEELHDHHKKWEAFYASNDKPFTWLTVIPNKITSEHRSLIMSHNKRIENHWEQYCRGAAIVVRSIMAATALKTVFFIQRPPYKWNVFTDIQEARAWAADQFKE